MLTSRFLLPALFAATVTVTGPGAIPATGATETTTSIAATSASGTPGTTAPAAASTLSGTTPSMASLAATHEDHADLTWDEGSEPVITLADAGADP